MDGTEVGTKVAGNTIPQPGKKFRAWLLTINNPEEKEINDLKSDDWVYMKYTVERGKKKGVLHIHAIVYYENPRAFGPIKSKWPRARIEVIRSFDKCVEYVGKEDTRVAGPWEYGSKPEQGRRNDLEELAAEVLVGERSLNELALTRPSTFVRYHKGLQALDDIRVSSHRTWMTKGTHYWGGTGVGKSHIVFDGYDEKTHYLWPNDGEWWDGYNGQEIVIMNDYRGEIKYNTLLQLVDKWPMFVRRRGRAPVRFVAKEIRISSSLPLEQIYKNREAEDSIEQLLRRFTQVCLNKRDPMIIETDTSLPLGQLPLFGEAPPRLMKDSDGMDVWSHV